MNEESGSDLAEPSGAPRIGGLLIALGACAAVFGLDQITKNAIVDSLTLGQERHVFGPLSLKLVHNPGSAFGIGSGGGPLIGVLAVLIVGGVLFVGRSFPSRWVRLVQGLVIGGALGNLWDRAFRPPGGFLGGYVVDFLRVPHWPVFNVADIAITCGAIALAWLVTRIPVDGEGTADAGDADEQSHSGVAERSEDLASGLSHAAADEVDSVADAR